MRDLIDYLKKLKSDIKSGRRIANFSDPSRGLEYNKIHRNRRVSGRIYNADIAAHPHIISNDMQRKNVLEKARKVNHYSQLTRYMMVRFNGRM